MPATAESLAERKKRARRILAGLHKLYPEADCALNHRSAFQLLVSTILSAQCTDKTVNQVTPVLFKEYATPRELAAAKREDIEGIIRPTGFFRNKAKSIQGAAARIDADFGGEVPDNMDDLLTLPGVARKTANVVLGTWFNKNEGIVVDTHVGRLATRLVLTWTSSNEKDAGKIEKDLMEIIPQKDWTYLGHALIWHGRKVCSARKPRCPSCTLSRDCPFPSKRKRSSADRAATCKP
jgi:endonuclease-3